jgi:hypothetical protein
LFLSLFDVYCGIGDKQARFAQLIPIFNEEQGMHVDNFIDAVVVCSKLAGWSDNETVAYARLRMGLDVAEFVHMCMEEQ